jgi:Na+/melibiose symporter-like transporter
MGTQARALSKLEKLVFDLLATSLMLGFFFFIGYLFIWFVAPRLGETKSTDIFTFLLVIPTLLAGHLLANLLMKKILLPFYTRTVGGDQ